MKTAMESIKEMVDVNTIIGDPVETPDGTIIIPVSRVACGFGAGGGEFEACRQGKGEKGEQKDSPPYFGGGSGGGVSVQPVGFLVVGNGQIRLIPVDNNVIYDRLIDVAPQILKQIQNMMSGENSGNNNESTPVNPGKI